MEENDASEVTEVNGDLWYKETQPRNNVITSKYLYPSYAIYRKLLISACELLHG